MVIVYEPSVGEYEGSGALTSPLGDLQVAGAQVLLHVLLEGLLEELLPLLQLHLGGLDPRLLGTRHPLRMIGLQLHWIEEGKKSLISFPLCASGALAKRSGILVN